MAQREVWQKPVTDAQGNTIEGATVTVFEQDGTTVATIYTSLTGGLKANPFTTSTDGLARFYAEPGRYVVRAQKGSFLAENIDVDLSMVALRSDLAASDSTVLVGGVEAGKTQVQINNLKILSSAPRSVDREYNVFSFYDNAISKGGGVFEWDPLRQKSQHTGGTIIAPEALAAWDGSVLNVANLLDWTGTGQGCFVLKDADEVSIDSFGCVSFEALGSVIDNSKMIQAAMDAGVPLIIPGESYPYSTTLIDRLHRKIRGFGPFKSRLVYKGPAGTYGYRTIKDTGEAWPTTRYAERDNFGIHGSEQLGNYAIPANAGAGLYLEDTNWMLFSNFAVFGLSDGLVIGNSCWANRFFRCMFFNCTSHGVKDLPKTIPGAQDATETSFVSCNMERCNIGVESNSAYLKLVDCTIEANQTFDVIAHKQIRLLSNYFELSQDGVVMVDLRGGSYGSQLSGNLFLMNNKANAIAIRYTEKVISEGNYFANVAPASGKAIKFNGVAVTNSQFTHSDATNSDYTNGGVTDTPVVLSGGISSIPIISSNGIRGVGGELTLQFSNLVPDGDFGRDLGKVGARFNSIRSRRNFSNECILAPIAQAEALNGSLFVDSVDGNIKFKDLNGTVRLLIN